jgi:nicotinamidase-related amidase
MDVSRLVQNSTASKTDPADVIMWSSPSPSSQEQASMIVSPNGSKTPAFPGPLLVVDHERDRQRQSQSQSQRSPLLPAAKTRTALLLIDIQRGLNTSHGFYGTERSTPALEDNVATLLSRCREYNNRINNSDVRVAVADHGGESHPIQMIHVFHRSSNPASPLHESGRAQKDGRAFMPCAAPDETSPHETVLSKRANSAFADGKLAALLAEKRIVQLVVVGIATDHCLSTSVRWAKDLGVVKRDWDCGVGADAGEEGEAAQNEGKIVVVRDATACFAKGGVGAEMVQRVSLASLEGEFAELASTADVMRELFA